MSDNGYAYAVARVRAKELALLGAQAVEQLMAAKSAADCVRILAEKGWGTGDANQSAEALLAGERDKTWALLLELTDDMSVFDVFLLANDYHNLKVSIKLVYTDQQPNGVFIPHGTVEPQQILDAVKGHDYAALPADMRAAAEEAHLAITHTGDGQLCDILVDRAALSAILAAGKASSFALIQGYAELVVAVADIKTAARCQKTGKGLDFMKKALCPCDSLDTDSLAHAAASGFEPLLQYLDTTDYKEAAEALRVSTSRFERYADNAVMELIRPQKYHSFTIEPLAAYLLARENELRVVRMILSGKVNKLSEQSVRERLREMYV
ncbi:MAG: V-type ATPase subunit [Acetanaerobacterium sp.]